jgi:hypothetical protein
MTSNQPTVAARQMVIDAAERGAQLAGGDQRFVKLTEVALRTVGLELARHLQAGESASLCVPADVAHDGRYHPGMVLLLDNCAVIAWFEGTLRIKVRSVAFALGDISAVATSTRDRGRLSPYRDAITFVAGGARHEFVLPSRMAEGRLTFMVSGALSGAVTFSHGSDGG